jgi:Tol biopolymer transport system component
MTAVRIITRKNTCRLFLFFLLMIFAIHAGAQYFGRNKVKYKKFNFKVLRTPDFEIYNYLKDTSTLNRIGWQSEHWYKMHQAIFKDTFEERNPLILYNDHSHFQQTSAISGLIDPSTGGVTEALKNRVVMPFMPTNQGTDHVLGHELVHAFQYSLLRKDDSLSFFRALNNIPLWMVEGLAEYMSIGYIDPLTAMWLRSSVINNKLPSLKDLTNKPYEYFPYRYGQAFWAYVTGIWGDTIIRPLYMEAAESGYEDAIKHVLGMDKKDFSNKWKESIRNTYTPYQQYTSKDPPGNKLIDKKNGGRMNIVPSISPDGKYIAFWSEKEVIKIDLYIADAATGKIIRKITSNSYNTHIDQYNSYESSVAWSPDSRQLAFVAFSEGGNRLIIADSKSGKIRERIDLSTIDGFSNPAWSPDGKNIAVNGLADGQSDLYNYNLDSKKITQLTNDRYTDLEPSFSHDGNWIVFSTDRVSIGNKYLQHHISHNIALLELATGQISVLNIFNDANNLNPLFGTDNQTIYFLSDRDGFRNLYACDIKSGQLLQLTNLYTGISGITSFSPAISLAAQTGQMVYSYYSNGDYIIYGVLPAGLTGSDVSADEVDMKAAVIPPVMRSTVNTIERNILTAVLANEPKGDFKVYPYRPKLQVDYIGNAGVGLTTSRFGTALAGGVNAIFGDMLSDHQVYSALALNGELIDIGGQIAYINQQRRVNWGLNVSHVPYLSGIERLSFDTIAVDGNPALLIDHSIDLLRTFEDQVTVFTAYPFSQIRRVEGGISLARYSFRLDQNDNYYINGVPVGTDHKRLPAPDGFNSGQVYAAYIGDNSYSGVASPLDGFRYHFELNHYFGVMNLNAAIADYRHYFRIAPFTLAIRNLYNSRFGKDVKNGDLPPLFLGANSLMHGYDANTFAKKGNSKLSINDIAGNNTYVTNVELRFPLSGPERLSAIKSRYFLTELALFTDGGIAWGNAEAPTTRLKAEPQSRSSKFIVSSGVSLRVNLFGYLVVEPFYAVPWQLSGWNSGAFGINFIPGW